MDTTAPTITVTRPDESMVDVELPGVGTVTVMAAAEDDGTYSFRLLFDGDPAKTPEVEPA